MWPNLSKICTLAVNCGSPALMWFKCLNSVCCFHRHKKNAESLNWKFCVYQWFITTHHLTTSFFGKQLCNCTCLRVLFILQKCDIWYCIIWWPGWIDFDDSAWTNLSCWSHTLPHVEHVILSKHFFAIIFLLFPMIWDLQPVPWFYKTRAYGQKQPK